MLRVTAPPTTPCELFTGSIRKDGYGRRGFQGEVMTAHRAAWIEANGPVPEGMVVRHLCHTRACIRLDHLRVGTIAENLQDNRDAGKPVNMHDGKTHCKNGHEFTPENTRIRKRGKISERVCRRCDGATTLRGRWPEPEPIPQHWHRRDKGTVVGHTHGREVRRYGCTVDGCDWSVTE